MKPSFPTFLFPLLRPSSEGPLPSYGFLVCRRLDSVQRGPWGLCACCQCLCANGNCSLSSADDRRQKGRFTLSARQRGPLPPLIEADSFSFSSTPTTTSLACFMRGFTRFQKSNMQSLGDRHNSPCLRRRAHFLTDRRHSFGLTAHSNFT